MKQSNPSNHVSRQCCHYFANVSRCLSLQTVSPLEMSRSIAPRQRNQTFSRQISGLQPMRLPSPVRTLNVGS